jgi:hypothetical protein
MTSSDALIEFVLARITDTEEAAKACGVDPADDSPVRWRYTRGTDEMLAARFGDDLPDGVLYRTWQGEPTKDGDYTQIVFWEEDGQHIERHDPARVIRRCAAHRRIVGRCKMILDSWDAMFEGGDRSTAPYPDVRRRERSFAGSTLRDLAALDADHPDYRQEWAQ